MIKYLLFVLAFSFIYFSAGAQQKQYKLLVKTTNADFNYKALHQIDTIDPALIRNVFHPVKGTYTVYTFMATFIGISFDNTEKEFHDILIIKVNKEQKVIDAYQYTLEWTDSPTSDLYKAMNKGVLLTNQLSLDELKFYKVDNFKKDKVALKESGTLFL